MTPGTSWPFVLLCLLSPALGCAAEDALLGTRADSDTLLIDFPTSKPVTLGQGWRVTEATQAEARCISFQPNSLDYNDKWISYRTVVDNESLNKSLDVSVSANFKSITGSFSASTSLARETKFASTSSYLAVVAEVWRGPVFVSPTASDNMGAPPVVARPESLLAAKVLSGSVLLEPEFEKLARTNKSEFIRQCGDAFVASIHSGAIVRAVVEFMGTSSSEKNTISAAASGGWGGGSISGAINSTMDSFQSRNRLSIRYRSLGGEDKTLPLSVAALNTEIENLPASAKAAPRPFKMDIRKYSTLRNWPSGPSTHQLTDQEIIAKVFGRLQTLKSYVSEALNSTWLLKLDTTKADVERLSDEISLDINKITQLAIQCAGSSNLCKTVEWRAWSDIDYRSRLPYRGTFADLRLDPSLSDLPEKLAQARIEQWIVEPLKIRCEIDNADCVLFEQVDLIRNRIVKRIKTQLEKQR